MYLLHLTPKPNIHTISKLCSNDVLNAKMKVAAVIASALVSAGLGSAVPVDPRFPDTGPFKMIVLAYEQPIHYSYVKASGGFFYIGKETNSTCGDVEPVLDGPNSAGALNTYGDGTQNTQQSMFLPKYSFLGVSVLTFTPKPTSISPAPLEASSPTSGLCTTLSHSTT